MLAFATTAAMPAMRAMNWRLSIFPLFARTAGTSRYSFRRSGETKIRSSATAFRTASLGVPPKAKAETSTPVSMTSLFLCRVGFSPDRLDDVFDVLQRQVGSFKCRLGHAEGRVETFLRSEDREDVILGGDLYRCRSHGAPFLFDCAISVAFHTDCGNRREGSAPHSRMEYAPWGTPGVGKTGGHDAGGSLVTGMTTGAEGTAGGSTKRRLERSGDKDVGNERRRR